MLVAGVSPGVGPALVLNGLNIYWQRHRENERIDTLSIPALTPTALEDGADADLATLWRSLCQTRQETDLLCVGSDGNLASPITRDTTLATLAKEWRLPVLLVVPIEWGAIAPAVATIALAREAKVTLAGVILHQHRPQADITAEAMADVLKSLTHTSILGTIPYLDDPSDEHKLANLISSLMLDVLIDQLEV